MKKASQENRRSGLRSRPPRRRPRPDAESPTHIFSPLPDLTAPAVAMDNPLMSPGFNIPSIGTPHHGIEEDQMINPQAQQAQQSQSQNRPPAYSFGGPDFSTPQSLLASGATPQNLGWQSIETSTVLVQIQLRLLTLKSDTPNTFE